MSLALRNGTTSNTPTRYRDPFSMARELLSWDPFFGNRPATAFSPAFEVKETDDAFVLKADLPGVEDANLDIAVHNNVLTISGKRTMEVPKGYQVLRQERGDIQFARSFSLPTKVDFDKCSATVKDGMLILKMSKTAEAQPRRISVRSQG